MRVFAAIANKANTSVATIFTFFVSKGSLVE
ncbi:TetR family transcriptional regulator [Colwellia sp. C1TZA3]|nr:TetR family transcriptional regulator [Colwellia sp. C1TZA3]